MTNTPIVQNPITQSPRLFQTLEEGLEKLSKYGKPRLSHMGGVDKPEWYCGMEMFAQGKGVEFNIKSDFKSTRPIDAVNQCYHRMVDALNKLGILVEM